MAILKPKPWVNLFGKMSIFRLFELYVGKMAIFGPKPWVNLFGKMSIFRLFELLDFIPQKAVFFVLE